jgi:hypothetical protein
MTSQRTSQELLLSRSWRFANSLWLLLSILGLGLLTWLGFLLHGFRAKKTSWIFSGFAWLAIVIVGVYLSNQAAAQTLLDPSATGLSELSGAVTSFSWLGGILHSCLTNKNWLSWKAHHDGKHPAVFGQAFPTASEPKPAPEPVTPATSPPAFTAAISETTSPQIDASLQQTMNADDSHQSSLATGEPRPVDDTRIAAEVDGSGFVFKPVQKRSRSGRKPPRR